jgi:uncharacterized protein involved in exopolysaccharide biosynthesis
LIVQRYWFLLILPFIAAGVTAAYTLSQPPAYEAQMVLIAQPPRLAAAPDNIAPPSTATFVPLLQSLGAARQVVTELHLDRAPDSLTPETFLREAVRANAVGGSPLLELRVRLAAPEAAAHAANRLAEIAIAAARKLSQQEAGDARDSLRALLDDSKRRYDDAQTAFETLRKQSQLDLLKKDVDAMLTERAAGVSLDLDVATQSATLERVDEETARRPRIDTITRSIDKDPALMETARTAAGAANASSGNGNGANGSSGGGGSSSGAGSGGNGSAGNAGNGSSGGSNSVLGLTLKDQAINRVHEAMDEEAARTRARLGGLKARQAARRQAGVDQARSPKLDGLYALERQLADRELDVSIAKKTYELAATQYENARLNVATRSAQLQLLTQAEPPERPLSRRTTSKALLAFVLAAVAALAIGYGRERWRTAPGDAAGA